MMRLLALLTLLSSFYTLAQENGTPVDTTRHSIRTAILLSAVVPGAGQVYNHLAMPKGKKKAFWKVPIIYAGLGATGYLLITNQQMTSELKNEYTFRENNEPGLPQWEAYDQQGILSLYQQYQNWRDFSILGLGLVYLLQVADAGVEAHFVSFDVSEDLSLQIEPCLLNQQTGGLRMTLKFR